MSLNDQKTKYRALDDWFKTPQGQAVAEAFSRQLHPLRDTLQGNTLVQLGGCGFNNSLTELNYKHKWVVTPCLNLQGASVIGALNRLPFDRNSVDCVIAPFTLEAFGWNKNPLDEIDRVLKPMGHVIFLGINPLSLWGGALWLGYLRCLGEGRHKPNAAWVLKQNFLNRGYQSCALDSFYYLPPVSNEDWLHHLAFLNEMGKMFPPCPAGFYCLIMQKQQLCLPRGLLRRVSSRRKMALPSPEPAWTFTARRPN